jgi:hypothetical protein
LQNFNNRIRIPLPFGQINFLPDASGAAEQNTEKEEQNNDALQLENALESLLPVYGKLKVKRSLRIFEEPLDNSSSRMRNPDFS